MVKQSPSAILVTATYALVLVFVVANSATPVNRLVGGRSKVKDVKTNQEVQDLGRYSVDEYNRSHGGNLKFSKVVKAEQQVASGIKYYLKIEATTTTTSTSPRGIPKTFDAVVFVKPWVHFHSKELLKFAPSTATMKSN